ncbi:MAG: hypothetical protein ACK542_08170, partial [Burkholderiales bacterium]
MIGLLQELNSESSKGSSPIGFSSLETKLMKSECGNMGCEIEIIPAELTAFDVWPIVIILIPSPYSFNNKKRDGIIKSIKIESDA